MPQYFLRASIPFFICDSRSFGWFTDNACNTISRVGSIQPHHGWLDSYKNRPPICILHGPAGTRRETVTCFRSTNFRLFSIASSIYRTETTTSMQLKRTNLQRVFPFPCSLSPLHAMFLTTTAWLGLTSEGPFNGVMGLNCPCRMLRFSAHGISGCMWSVLKPRCIRWSPLVVRETDFATGKTESTRDCRLDRVVW